MKVSTGAYELIYNPSVGESGPWYINDHTFIRDKENVWHLFGITHAEPANPLDELHFAHATAGELLQPQWAKQPHALSVDRSPRWNEKHLWAPHVIEHDGLDVMAEEMTIQETRGYVKRVLRTYGIYRWLYDNAAPTLPVALNLPKRN